MTEEEAKEKVCPFRNGLTQNSIYRVFTVDNNNCIGSECMMWNEHKQSGNITYHGGCGLKQR